MKFRLTHHALRQMHARGISHEAVQAALCYGRRAWTRGACLYAIGWRDAARARAAGRRLDRFEGVHVVTSSDGAVLTVYRNHDLRGLRPRRTHRHTTYSLTARVRSSRRSEEGQDAA